MLLTLLCCLASPCFGAADQEMFEQGLQRLVSKKFKEKELAIQEIGKSGDERAESILRSILQGKLYYLKKDKSLVYVKTEEGKYRITHLLTGEDGGLHKKRKVKKITINNALRRSLKATIARISLGNPDPAIRLKAVNAMLGQLNEESLTTFGELVETETDPKVKQAMTTALSLAKLQSPEPEKRLEGLNGVEGNLSPVVKNELNSLIAKEEDQKVLSKAKSVLASIDAKIAWFSRLETLFFGLSLGSVLVLAAIGLSITFGVIGVINMAHGELIMIGAYTTYVIQLLLPDAIWLSLILAVPAAFCISGLVGIVIEKSVIRFLYGRPLETLLATFGVSLVLQQTVRSIFSPLNRSVATPEWMSGSITINPILSLTTNRVTIFIFAMVVFAGLFILLKKSSMGLQVRAIAQNRGMARSMGVRASRVDALTFGLGSGIAGIAGVALSQLTNVGPNLGQAYIIDSFMVVVFGGVGNLWGTLLGGLSLGVANKFLEPWSGAVLAKIFILVFIILFIQKRPQGLFPQKGRAAE